MQTWCTFITPQQIIFSLIFFAVPPCQPHGEYHFMIAVVLLPYHLALNKIRQLVIGGAGQSCRENVEGFLNFFHSGTSHVYVSCHGAGNVLFPWVFITHCTIVFFQDFKVSCSTDGFTPLKKLDEENDIGIPGIWEQKSPDLFFLRDDWRRNLILHHLISGS